MNKTVCGLVICLICVADRVSFALESAKRSPIRHRAFFAQGSSRADPNQGEGVGSKPQETPAPTGVRNGIDWSTLDVTKGRPHRSAIGMKFIEYDVNLANSKETIRVLWAEEADKQDDKFKYKEDGKTPLGLEITYNCVSYVFDARGIICKGESRVRDFWIANDSFPKLIDHNCVEERDDRKAKAALEAGKRVYIVYKSLDGEMIHVALMKKMNVPALVAMLDSTCDSKTGVYALAKDVEIKTIQGYFEEHLLSSFYIEK